MASFKHYQERNLLESALVILGLEIRHINRIVRYTNGSHVNDKEIVTFRHYDVMNTDPLAPVIDVLILAFTVDRRYSPVKSTAVSEGIENQYDKAMKITTTCEILYHPVMDSRNFKRSE